MGFKPRKSGSKIPKSPGIDRWRDLTDRQREIGLMLMAGDKNRQEMADALDIELKTVDSHRLQLLSSIGLKNSVQLTHYGLRHGLVKL
jgi:two-component system invasion response regulator UvrY